MFSLDVFNGALMLLFYFDEFILTSCLNSLILKIKPTRCINFSNLFLE